MSVLCFQYEQTSLVEQQAERIRNLFGRETAFRNKAMTVELMTSEIEYLFVRMTFRISWKLETWFWVEWISSFLFLDIYTNLHDFIRIGQKQNESLNHEVTNSTDSILCDSMKIIDFYESISYLHE